jgi:hypothetical protein
MSKKIDLYKRLCDEINKAIQEEESGKKPQMDKNLLLEYRVHYALDIYKNNPEFFNSYPDDIDVNSGKEIMEYFCICVDNQEKIPKELLEYFRDCFQKILKGGLTLNRCLNLTIRNKKNPYIAPEYLKDITHDIMNRGVSLTDACIAQEYKTKKDVTTLMNHFNEFSKFLISNWFVHQTIVNKIKFADLRKDLKKWQIKALKDYFKTAISEDGRRLVDSESK